MLNEKKLLENVVILPFGLKVINLTSKNLYFDDGSVLPKGNPEVLSELLPIPVKGGEKKQGGITIESYFYQASPIFFEDWFQEFIENENIYFIGSHITCSTYSHPRVLMTQIIYNNNGKKIASSKMFSTHGKIE